MTEGALVSDRIARDWDEIAPLLGGDRPLVERALTTILRALDTAVERDEASLVSAIFGLLRPFAALRAWLERVGREVTALHSKGTGMPAGTRRRVRYVVVPVHYGTDRAMGVAPGGAVTYGAERGELAFGVADVGIPDDHRMGRLEKPRLWRLQFREDPQHHIVVLALAPLLRTDFVARGRTTLAESSKRDVLVFVHGFRVDFTDALTQAAQLAYDLHFEGLTAVYSWPSEGTAAGYPVDANNVAWSRPHFREFLDVMTRELGAGAVHIVAHSMGSQLVAEALAAHRGAPLRQVVFAAPDLDAGVFKNLAAAFPGKADRITLYASSKDRALQLSKLLQKHARAGDSGADLVLLGSVDTVDATNVETGFSRHSYFGDSRSVLTDLFDLIHRGVPPGERGQLRPMKRYGMPYWIFSP